MMVCLTVVNAADRFVTFTNQGAAFPVVKDGSAVNIVIDNSDYEGVCLALNNLQPCIFSLYSLLIGYEG